MLAIGPEDAVVEPVGAEGDTALETATGAGREDEDEDEDEDDAATALNDANNGKVGANSLLLFVIMVVDIAPAESLGFNGVLPPRDKPRALGVDTSVNSNTAEEGVRTCAASNGVNILDLERPGGSGERDAGLMAPAVEEEEEDAGIDAEADRARPCWNNGVGERPSKSAVTGVTIVIRLGSSCCSMSVPVPVGGEGRGLGGVEDEASSEAGMGAADLILIVILCP